MQRLATLVLLTLFALFASACSYVNKTDVGSVTIDCSKTLAELIAAGHYDWKNPAINAKNFSMDRECASTVHLEVVRFSRWWIAHTTRNIEDQLDDMGYRSATLPELLAVGAKFPELQRQFPIVALGSSIPLFPYLDESGEGRGLALHSEPSTGCWDEITRFLVVRKGKLN